MSLFSNLFHRGSVKRAGSVCLLLDFENLVISLRSSSDNTTLQLDPILLLANAQAPTGAVTLARAYADWRHFGRYADELTRHGIQTVQAPNHRLQGKNATDIQMAVEATDLLHTREDLDIFVLVTGDSDFNPLVHLLRSRGKRVIGIGVRGTVSPYFKKVCDDFMYYDDVLKQAGLETDSASEVAPKKPEKKPVEKRPAARRSSAVLEPKIPAAPVHPAAQPAAAPTNGTYPSGALDILGLEAEYRIAADRMKALLPMVLESVHEARPSHPGELKKGLLKRFPNAFTPHEAGALAYLLRQVGAYGSRDGFNWLFVFQGRDADAFDMLLASAMQTLVNAGTLRDNQTASLSSILFGEELNESEVSMRIARGKKLLSDLQKATL